MDDKIEELNKGLLEKATKIIEILKSSSTNCIIRELGYTDALQPLLELGNSEIYRSFKMQLMLDIEERRGYV